MSKQQTKTNKRMKMKNMIMAALPALALCNCASIVSKSKYPVSFQSEKPTKFTVTSQKSNGSVYSGTTPATVTLPASEGFFQAAKYDIQTPKGNQSLSADIDPWVAGNILNLTGLVGIAIDGASGAMWKLPDTYKINP